MSTDWKKIRADFPVAENICYFQSAGMSPIPTPVLNDLFNNYRSINQYGDIHWPEDMARFAEMRSEIASMINAGKSDIAFVASNSLAMSIVALSMKNVHSNNFNIISTTDEFPSNTVPFEYPGIKIKYVSPVQSRYSVESVLEQIDKETIAVVTSYVQYCTGFRQNLEALGNELNKRNILFIVNATQAFPFYPIDVAAMKIDVLTASMHKWGCAGITGTLFCTSDEFRKKYPSPIAGWLSVDTGDGDFIHTDKGSQVKLLTGGERYIFGSMNYQTLLTLRSSLDYLKNIGFENIRNRILELSDYFLSKCKSLPVDIISPVEIKEERSAIVVISLRNKSNSDCLTWLESKKIFPALRNGNIRVSFNIFNNFEDIDRLADHLRQYCQ